ncbi:hypothetical protein [Kitasatospora sp. NPDC048715]
MAQATARQACNQGPSIKISRRRYGHSRGCRLPRATGSARPRRARKHHDEGADCPAAERHGLHAEVEARATDGWIRTDVLVTGDDGRRIGWEAQYSPITTHTVRRRSRATAEHGIVPLWVTDTDRSAVFERAPSCQADRSPP